MIKFLSALFHPIPSDYEAWLEKLSLKGWYPKKINQWNSVVMEFEKSEPKKYRYVLDLQAAPESDYIKIYKDFGWEFCGKITNAFLWRMEYGEQRPESFTDEETMKERNNRFVKSLSFSFIFQIIFEIAITLLFFIYCRFFEMPVLAAYSVVLALSYIYTIYLTSIMLKIKKGDKK